MSVPAAHVAERVVGDVDRDEPVRDAGPPHPREDRGEVYRSGAGRNELALRDVALDLRVVVLQVAGDDAAGVPAQISHGIDAGGREPTDVELDLHQLGSR